MFAFVGIAVLAIVILFIVAFVITFVLLEKRKINKHKKNVNYQTEGKRNEEDINEN